MEDRTLISRPQKTVQHYLLNCFLLTLPVLIWNIALTNHLPQAYQPRTFWHQIPPFLAYGENGSRIVVFGLAAMMPLQDASKHGKTGFWVYGFGLLVYFASWLALLLAPASPWSRGWLGFVAPAYTPLIWLTGIAFIGHSFYFQLPFHRGWFLGSALLFVIFHVSHTAIIYGRIYG